MLKIFLNHHGTVAQITIAFIATVVVTLIVYFLLRLISRHTLKLLTQYHLANAVGRDINFLSFSLSLFLMVSVGGNVFGYYHDLGMKFDRFLEKLSSALLLLTILALLYVIVDLTMASFRQRPNLKNLALNSYSQIIKIAIFIVFSILAASFLFGKDPWVIVTGMAAMTTLLTFMFKDSILGIVSSIQIAFNNTVKVGDWVEFSQYGANGKIINITLTTLQIKNSDNTISCIPTYALISNNYKNWQAMVDSKARRIKRAININVQSIKAVDNTFISALENNGYHIERKALEAETVLTNIAVFRQYIQQYLEQHPSLNSTLSRLVIELEPTADGLPIQVVCFSIYTDTKQYQAVQANIIDYMIINLSAFELLMFQNVSEAPAATTH
jgi:miniconductance mechanosensitive channel